MMNGAGAHELSLKDKATVAVKSFFGRHLLDTASDAGSQPAPVNVSQAVVDREPGTEIHDVARSLSGIHNILKYDQYDAETGLFFNNASVSFCFAVLPQTGADEEMTAKLAQLFTPIPPGVGVQWTLFGTPMIQERQQAYVDQRHIAVDNGRTSPFFVELAKRRVEHINKFRGRPLFAGTNFMVKDFRLVFSVTRTGKKTDVKLCQEMFELRETLHSQLKTSSLPAAAMDAEALIEFVSPILDPQQMFTTDPPQKRSYDDTVSIRDQVTGIGQSVKVRHDQLLFGTAPEEGEKDERIAMRAFAVLRYPQKKELWEMANIIGSFFDDGLQYPCPFVVSGGMYSLDPTKVDSAAQLKAARAKQNAKSKMAEFQPELAAIAEDWTAVIHQINAGGTMTQLYHTLLLFSPISTMNRAAQVARNIWRTERFEITPAQSLHLPLLYASLPMTLTEALRDDMKRFRVITSKTTVNGVDMSPVIAEWKGCGTEPVMMFFGRRGTPTYVDFYANPQGNYNVYVAGTSGSGKSVTMNEIVSSYRGIGARAWVIDVGRAYKNLIALQKGTFIEFTPESKICMNPFSWVGQDKENSFKQELKVLKPLIGRMASPAAPLSEFQYALIEEAITGVWNDWGPETNPTKIQSYLAGNIKDERNRPERLAHELAKQLQPFTENGIFGSFFNGPANINLDGDMIGLELEELKAAPDLRRVVLFVLTSRIAHDMYLSRDRKKLCLIDEAWQLLGADKETAEFIEEGYRRARKYNGIFCVGTQGIEDAYKNDASRAAYNNADFKLFLRQNSENFEKLIAEGTVTFPPAIKRMIQSLRTEGGQYSEMLISSPNGKSVVRHIPDPFSLMMTSSKAEDFEEIRTLMAAGNDTFETLQIMMRRRGFHD